MCSPPLYDSAQITGSLMAEQSVGCVCFERKDLWPRCLACWFTVIPSGLSLKVMGQSLRSQDEMSLY